MKNFAAGGQSIISDAYMPCGLFLTLFSQISQSDRESSLDEIEVN